MRVNVGKHFMLTTEHAASSYGIPVLVDEAGQPHGPGDALPGGGCAGERVWCWACCSRTEAELEAARRFLAQQP